MNYSIEVFPNIFYLDLDMEEGKNEDSPFFSFFFFFFLAWAPPPSFLSFLPY